MPSLRRRGEPGFFPYGLYELGFCPTPTIPEFVLSVRASPVSYAVRVSLSTGMAQPWKSSAFAGQVVRRARAGLPYTDGGTTAARLLSLEARAAAALGDKASAVRTVEAAKDARNAYASGFELPGVFTFPEAKQWAYAGTTLLAVSCRQHVGRAVEASSRAIALYESAPQEDRSSGDLQAARLDLAGAHLVEGDIDSVRDMLTGVLEVEPGRRTASISKRLQALSTRLAEPVYARSPVILSLRENVRDACSRPALTSPPEPAK